MTSFIRAIFGATFGLGLGLMMAWIAGESPWHVLKILALAGFGSPYDFGMSLFYTAPLILTGLAVAIPFKSGLFNIGAEGQLTMGAIAVSGLSVMGFQPKTALAAISVSCLVAFSAGAVWSGLCGYLKARRGSHEVITTIMMNFIAAGVSSYLALYAFKDPDSAQAETAPLPKLFHLIPFDYLNGAPMGWQIFVLMLLVLGLHFWIKTSVWGYELKSVGENEIASERYGISRTKVWVTSMLLGGGLAGLVGVIEVLGNSHRFKLGFSADYGFVGIAVALVARGNLLAILPSAFLFGVLQKGAASLDLETEKITRDLAYVIQGLIILGVAAEGLWERRRRVVR
jgi:simple sugar transport system permease protein